MKINKEEILNEICYTDLVYDRIRKKLSIESSNKEIEILIYHTINETQSDEIIKNGKNYYFSNRKRGIRVTINSNTIRVITVDKI
jgi:ATP-dependent protease ClpP protease subunit